MHIPTHPHTCVHTHAPDPVSVDEWHDGRRGVERGVGRW